MKCSVHTTLHILWRDLLLTVKNCSGKNIRNGVPYNSVQDALAYTKDGPIMTTTPFLAMTVRGKKDAILLRARARRVAGLIGFDAYEQACIAAGVFVIACHVLTQLGKGRICFQIDHQQLQVFAEGSDTSDPNRRLQGLLAGDARSLPRLVKPLPPRDQAAEDIELGWLIRQVEKASGETLFDEVARQNQEVLALLHELRLYRGAAETAAEKSRSPHAA